MTSAMDHAAMMAVLRNLFYVTRRPRTGQMV